MTQRCRYSQRPDNRRGGLRPLLGDRPRAHAETFFSAMPEKISSLRSLSYLSALWGAVHPCQILPIMRSSFWCDRLSGPTLLYDAKNQIAGSVLLWPIFT